MVHFMKLGGNLPSFVQANNNINNSL